MFDFEKILKTKGKTKADLARFLEIQANNVNRVILNENITLSKIETICKFLDISVIDALRISGYDDTPGVIPKETEKKKTLDYKNLLLSLSDQLIELYNQKVLAPYSIVEEKDEEIRKLNREIGKLESELEKLKNDFRKGETETLANNTVPNSNNPIYSPSRKIQLPINDLDEEAHIVEIELEGKTQKAIILKDNTTKRGYIYKDITTETKNNV